MSGEFEFDLSRAAKLQDVIFRCVALSAKWISKALHTARSRNLQRISFELQHIAIGVAVWETVHQEWADLDHLLVKFWTSRSIRPKVMYEPGKEEEMKDHVARLFPEAMRRGIIDLVLCLH